MQPASIAGRKTSFSAGKNQHRRPAFFLPKTLFFPRTPEPSITGRKKTRKNSETEKINKKKKQNKTKPKLQILSSKIKSKQQI
jgi:hypothetical protein